VLGLIVERASHVRKCPRCNKVPPQSRGYGTSSRVSSTSTLGERSTSTKLMDEPPRCPPCSCCGIELHDRVVRVLEDFMLEAGATKGRDLRLEVRRIRSRAF
jgi:hypothetical protein